VGVLREVGDLLDTDEPPTGTFEDWWQKHRLGGIAAVDVEDDWVHLEDWTFYRRAGARQVDTS
jgi:hypothetical protein